MGHRKTLLILKKTWVHNGSDTLIGVGTGFRRDLEQENGASRGHNGPRLKGFGYEGPAMGCNRFRLQVLVGYIVSITASLQRDPRIASILLDLDARGLSK